MGKYITSQDLWNSFGESAFTKVRAETIGTGSGALTTFSFEHDNLISSSVTIYTGSTAISSSLYTINYDDGTVTLTASATPYTANYDYAGLKDSYIQDVINRAEEQLEAKTGRNFDITTTSEYIDIEQDQTVYFLKNYPVVNIVGLSSNANANADAASWVNLVEGYGQDYLLQQDEEMNKFTILDNFPSEGAMNLKADYVYGYSTIPDSVKDLAVLYAQRKMVNSGIYKAVVQGDQFNEAQLQSMDNQIQELVGLLKKQNIDII
jgi:hypothetical protein